MFEIRRYNESDARAVGILIAETFGDVNLAGMSPPACRAMLGPFAFARSRRSEHRDAIAEAITAPSVWVAVRRERVVGVLRGGRIDQRGRTVLSSLFVDRKHHRLGIGRALVERFEGAYATPGLHAFTVAATLHAVPFYLSVGYKKSTGVRLTASFGEPGLPYQPMRKIRGEHR